MRILTLKLGRAASVVAVVGLLALVAGTSIASAAGPLDGLTIPAVDPALLAKFPGTYRNAGGNELTIVAAGARLTVGPAGAPPAQRLTLAATAEKTFKGIGAATTVTFQVDGDKVTGFEWGYWVGTVGDTGASHDTMMMTTVKMDKDRTVQACCPFATGPQAHQPCPAPRRR